MADLDAQRLIGRASALGLAGLAVACASTREAPVNERAAEILEGLEPTGETRICVPIRQVSTITGVTEDQLLVRLGLNDYYLNEPNTACSGVTRINARIEYTTSQSQICRNDIIRVVENQTGILFGSCAFGTFEAMRPKPEDEAETSDEG